MPDSNQDYTEDEYLEMIEDALNQLPEDRRHPFYPMNNVAGIVEWKRFKAALARWLEEQDRQHTEAFDNNAVEEEHEDD